MASDRERIADLKKRLKAVERERDELQAKQDRYEQAMIIIERAAPKIKALAEKAEKEALSGQ